MEPTLPLAAAPPPAAAPAAEPLRRLHPLTPLLRGFRFVVVLVVAISWQGYQNLGTTHWAEAVGALAVLVLFGTLISYLFTGYHVVGRELRIREGLLVRRTRAIPLERVQSVELVQPAVGRLFGLAELRLEVVGGSRTEAPLAYLRLAEATALRARLLALARPVPVRTDGTAETPAATVTQPEQVVHVVANRDLVFSQLLRPQWWLVPIGVAGTLWESLINGAIGWIGIASTITAVIGVVSAPVRVLLADWRFTLGTAADGLHIRRGLLETRSSTVPPGRIQSVVVEWPLLWRAAHWVRVQMHVAGVRDDRQQQRAGLLPVGTAGDAESVLAQALPGVALRQVAIRPVPSRARVFAPLRAWVLGYHLGPAAFATRDGLLTRRLVIVPYGRIQSVRVRQGPLQRVLRLATVLVDVAGGGPSGTAWHVDVAEARTLALALAEHSRAARATR
jgi:putative membrane protein